MDCEGAVSSTISDNVSLRGHPEQWARPGVDGVLALSTVPETLWDALAPIVDYPHLPGTLMVDIRLERQIRNYTDGTLAIYRAVIEARTIAVMAEPCRMAK